MPEICGVDVSAVRADDRTPARDAVLAQFGQCTEPSGHYTDHVFWNAPETKKLHWNQETDSYWIEDV